MSALKRNAGFALSNGDPHWAFHELERQGLNPHLLCGAVCSVEQAWKLTPGTKRQALKNKGFSINRLAKFPASLFEAASLLRRLNREGFFSLPDYGHASLCGLLESAALQLRNTFGAYPRQNSPNIYAAALVVLLREVDCAREWAGLTVTQNGEPSLEGPSQKGVPRLLAYRLASELMRQGVPNDVLTAMRADFADATGRVLDFPSPEALRGRCRHVKKYSELWNIANGLCACWINQYSYLPGTLAPMETPNRLAPPLAMLPKTSP
jgi:hypothetical protein